MGNPVVLSTNPCKAPLSTRHQTVSTVLSMIVKEVFQKYYPADSNHERMQTPCQPKGEKKAHGKMYWGSGECWNDETDQKCYQRPSKPAFSPILKTEYRSTDIKTPEIGSSMVITSRQSHHYFWYRSVAYSSVDTHLFRQTQREDVPSRLTHLTGTPHTSTQAGLCNPSLEQYDIHNCVFML